MEQNTKKIHSIWRQIYLNNGCFFERFCCTDVSSIFRSFFTRARCQYCSVSSIFYLFIYYFNQAQERKRTKKNVYEKRITLLWCKIFASVLTFVFFSFFFFSGTLASWYSFQCSGMLAVHTIMVLIHVLLSEFLQVILMRFVNIFGVVIIIKCSDWFWVSQKEEKTLNNVRNEQCEEKKPSDRTKEKWRKMEEMWKESR